jgi:CPA1 family monovalent cation:H+ antiporter
MIEHLLLGFGLVAATAVGAVAARRLEAPPAIVLVVLGIVAGFLPGMPHVVVDPEFVLLVLLPPLLYYAGVGMSWRGFRLHIVPILMLAVGCVLFTAAAVAAAGHFLLSMPWPVGFVLGAIVSPPDAVAPMAIARRLAIPERILTIIEGEGLVNDATALIVFSFAVAAVTEGTFSPAFALGKFAVIVAAELGWGLFIGWAALWLRRWSRDPRIEIILALLTPFATFWPLELLGASGVIATVVAGLYVSWNGRRFISSAARLQGYFVWDLLVATVEGIIFVLTGLQARIVADTLGDTDLTRLILACVSISIVVIVVRFLWVFATACIPKLLPRRHSDGRPIPPWQYPFAISFVGIRGVVSVAAALSVPVMAGADPFPDRGLMLVVTFCVVVVTLVGQGATFPWIIGWLGLANAGEREQSEAKAQELSARLAGIDAVLERMDTETFDGVSPEAVDALRRRHADRRDAFVKAADQNVDVDQPASLAAQILLVGEEREALDALYERGSLSDGARRRVERELDLEESRVRYASASADPAGREG